MHAHFMQYEGLDPILAASYAFQYTITQQRLKRYRRQHPEQVGSAGLKFKLLECPACKSRDHNARPVLPPMSG